MSGTTAEQRAKGRRTVAQTQMRRLRPSTSVRSRPEEYVARLRGESDRGAIILIAALIEETLQAQLYDDLKGSKEQLDEDLFKANRPGSSFSSKTVLAAATGSISPQLRQLIDHLRLMRNAAAHIDAHISFDDGPIREAALAMMDEQSVEMFTSANAPSVHLRDAFIICCLHIQKLIGPGGAGVRDIMFETGLDASWAAPFAHLYKRR